MAELGLELKLSNTWTCVLSHEEKWKTGKPQHNSPGVWVLDVRSTFPNYVSFFSSGKCIEWIFGGNYNVYSGVLDKLAKYNLHSDRKLSVVRN